MGRHDPDRVIMVGTSPSTRGGIASVVQALRAAGLFTRWPVEYIESHCDGGFMAKLVCAARALGRFAFALLRHRHAVLHVHTASRASFWRKALFIVLARLARWPYIVHLHGGGFERFHAGAPRWQQRIIETHLAKAACVITVSPRWSEWVERTVAGAHVTCIPNPASSTTAPYVTRDAGRVAFVGRCEAAKGVFELVEALAAVRVLHPAVRLVCAGDGDLEAVARHARERGLASRIEFPGWVDARSRAELLARAAIFALPSHAEGLPVSLLEAMGAGCAVVASDAGGIPDVIVNGVNGLLVPAGDVDALATALECLLRDREFAARLGAEARATVARNHTPGLALARLERIYTALGVRRESPARSLASRGLREVA